MKFSSKSLNLLKTELLSLISSGNFNQKNQSEFNINAEVMENKQSTTKLGVQNLETKKWFIFPNWYPHFPGRCETENRRITVGADYWLI